MIYLTRKYEKQTKMEKYFASKYDRLLEYQNSEVKIRQQTQNWIVGHNFSAT